jgi:hypothetical protein
MPISEEEKSMKNLVRIAAVALVVGAFSWATSTAWAQCSNLADTTNPECKAALKGQYEIQKAARGYIAAVQKTALAMIQGSRAGTNTTAQKYLCASGAKIGKTCYGNNGGCVKGKTACNVNSDCTIPGDTCQAAKGCNGKGCSKSKVPCVTNADCTLAGDTCDTTGLEVNECQAASGKSPFSKNVATAQTNLEAGINGGPYSQSLSNLEDNGLVSMPDCPIGRCTDPAGIKCNALNERTVCNVAGGGFCDYMGAGATPAWISNLAQCIEASVEGDFDSGKLVDTTLRPFAKMTGTGSVAPQAKVTGGGGPADLLPRAVLQLNGSQDLAIGTAASPPNRSPGGSVQTLAMAHCTDGNLAPSCLNNADCGGKTYHCVRNAKVCVNTALDPSPTMCTSDADCPGSSCGTVVTGPIRVHKCCGENPSVWCLTSYPGCTCGYTGCEGDILSVSEASSNGMTTCLFTRTADAGNGTSLKGAINLVTGDFVTQSPILTDVYLMQAPYTGCGRCKADHTCDDNSISVGAKCTAATGQVDQACLSDPGALVGTIPNLLTLTTGSKTMNPGAGGGNKFCGYCNSDVGVGCQSNTDCADNFCNFGETVAGFRGDTTVSQISVSGEKHQYAPTAVGVFCTGKTSSLQVNSSFGLPGPVRVIQPYIWGYNFSKDK